MSERRSGALPGTKYADAHEIAFARAVSASQLAAGIESFGTVEVGLPLSGPAPPVKGHNVQMESGAASPLFIPLKPVE